MDAVIVDVTYRGLRMAEGARFVGDDEGGFVEVEAPLPVGSQLTVCRESGDPREARVLGVVEQEASAKSPPGMRIAFTSVSPEVDDSDDTKAHASSEPGKKARRTKKKASNGR